MSLIVGTAVRVQRDEVKHPSRGSWLKLRGRIGTIVEVNRSGLGATEYGVGFGKSARTDSWFLRHEIKEIK